MNQAIQVREQTVELPSTAPLVRITAGFGSAGQKTWNLRRPVTLLGARRPAHIVLHDRAPPDKRPGGNRREGDTHLTPDVQVVIDPSNAPNKDAVTVFGLRLRTLF